MSDWKEVTAEWQGEMVFLGRNSAGGVVQMGEWNGQPGLSPMELLLAGVAGCTGVDVASILKKKRQPLDALKVRIRGKRAQDHPRIYTEISVEYLLWGNGLDPKAVEQAIALSEEKYCSASAMLRKSAQMHSSYRLLAVGEPEPA